MFGLGNPNSSIYVFLVVLSQFLWFVLMWFGFSWKFPMEKRQNFHFCTISKLSALAKRDSPTQGASPR